LKHPKLFTPLQLGGITLPNRIVVSPMCQYSAVEGSMTDWHAMHLGQFACSGAGLTMVEATGVTPEGRITHGCTGLYSDENERAMAAVVKGFRKITRHPIGVQLAHAGRKASAQPPFDGGKALSAGESPWQTVAPSAIAFGDGWPVPHELSAAEIRKIVEDFAAAAARAVRVGFDAVELHGAHGYLLHQFLSPLSNARGDAYGKNRLKFPLEAAEAVRAVWPKDRCMGARISANDWVEGGLGPEDAISYARELKRIGLDYVCISSGALVPHARIPVAPGYQAGFAQQVRNAVPIAVRAVGMIVDPGQAEEIVASGSADMVALARGFLDDPRWVWHAAERYGVRIDYPPQYARSHPDVWPGAQVARPRETV
jgi:2,4-dienoyl-CoA reductase-like NADH-dependent reductase (Old Yellow Enzyme family)